MAVFPVKKSRTRGQQKAFYLNAYNTLSINMVQTYWPLRSLRSLGTLFDPVWAHDAGSIRGGKVSLRVLENDVLRAVDDPRVPMAINGASMSCPDLRHEPWVEYFPDEQLDDQAVRFLNLTNKGIILNEKDNELRLSSICDGFEAGVESPGGVEAFVRRYRPDLAAALTLVTDIPYDWRVNGGLSGRGLRCLRADLQTGLNRRRSWVQVSFNRLEKSAYGRRAGNQADTFFLGHGVGAVLASGT
ncbi:DUF547 domain-containing protein [Marinobacter caseinilyticus]|uniref:DUF547 domain-containing protein n=1 Tax=Marinobacter caseinilyticus TaxID=2692195 RepID=UPI001F1ADB59|nr:DUF547 domain-containing protein [Marinobacter caseinilyticus]